MWGVYFLEIFGGFCCGCCGLICNPVFAVVVMRDRGLRLDYAAREILVCAY